MISRVFRLSRARAAALFVLAVTACSTDHGSDPNPAPAPARTVMPDAIPTWVAHRDARLGVPSFVWIAHHDLPKFASAEEAARLTVRGLGPAFGMSREALATLGAPEIHDGGAGGIIAKVDQKVGDVEVFRGRLNVIFNRRFEPIAASGFVAPTIDGSDAPIAVDARAALDRAFTKMTGRGAAFTHEGDAHGYAKYRAAGLRQPARVKRVLFPVGEDGRVVRLEPAHYVEIMLAKGGARSFVLSATTGDVLFENDLVRHDQFQYRVWADPNTLLPMDGPQGNDSLPHPTGKPDGYRPALLAPQLVSLQNFPYSKNDPWLSPNATETRGNNVDAYVDLAGTDGLDDPADFRGTTTGTRVFDHVYDTTKGPQTSRQQQEGSIAHLFYMVNFLHDWFYDAGFDEKSGNPQYDNYGRGGKEGDPILAEAQDFSGTNNSNAATPADGMLPRIQMFLFSGPSPAQIDVLSPANIAGTKAAGTGSFGMTSFDVTGGVVLAQDGQGTDPNDACEAISNNVAGKIVLVHRGTCSFVQKTQAVQDAGGIGIIIANVATSASPDSPPFMGGAEANISIPALSVNLSDGKALESNLGGGVSVRMKRQAQVDLDGALDSTIVAHEWGHVLSNRLVNDANGLNTNQSGGLGEGWGDFVALLLAARDDDPFGAAGKNWSGAYPLAGYAMSGSGADYYFGIRRVPYSVELTKDPLTFKHIESGVALPTTAPISFGEDGSTNSEVHSTGEVWATMLWECYVSLLRDGRYTFKQAQDRMKRYLVGGLKLTPPDPTLLEARDAMLAAAFASDEKDFRGFFEAFARRGAGVGAEGPPKDSGNNSGVKESYLVGNDVQVLKATITDDVISCDHDGILDDGEVGTIEIHLRNAGVGPLTETKLKVSSPVPMLFPEGDTTQVGTLKPFDSTKVKIRVSLATAPAGKPLSIDVAVDDPSLALPRTIHVPIATHFDSDQSDAADNVDHVDTTGTSWTAAGSGGKKWSRTTTTGDGWWTVPDQPEPADQKLTSAPFTVDGTQFTLQFRHRWSFRRSTRRNVDVDGGLIEISTDGGKLWKDISEVAKPDYNTKIDTGGFGDNPLKGRPAYGNKSPGYPAQWVTSSLDVTLPSKPDQVQIRFRAGSGTGFAGAPGWEIDDIALLGISSKPFWGYLPHADACDPDGPTADAGQPKTVLARTLATLQGSGTHPKGLPINFVWSQAGGQPVELRGPATPTVSFDAPDTRENKTLTFVLRTNDGARLSPASKVDVTVVRNGPPVEQFSIGGGCSQSPSSAGWAAPLLGALAFLVARRRKKS